MASRLTILDLDRTVFDSDRFLRDLLQLLAVHHELNAAAFRAGIPAYRHGDLYDFHGHLRATTGLSSGQLEILAAPALAGRSYIYPDVIPWLAARQTAGENTLIMTVGMPGFQQFKLSYAPELASLPHQIVDHNKGRVLASQLRPGPVGWQLGRRPGAYDQIRLVDDNPATFEALGIAAAAIASYHIVRLGEPYADQPTPTNVRRISSFLDLMK